MRRHRSLSVWLLTLIGGFGCLATPLAAQHRIAGPRASDVWALSADPVARVASSATIPDTVQSRSTHWREGALVGGIAGAVAGGWLASHLCALSSEGHGSCGGAALGGAVVFGTAAGALGALVGALFPKRPEPLPTGSGTAT
jgi:hypothetical protein